MRKPRPNSRQKYAIIVASLEAGKTTAPASTLRRLPTTKAGTSNSTVRTTSDAAYTHAAGGVLLARHHHDFERRSDQHECQKQAEQRQF